jgi:hypothetical protein
MRAGNTVQLPPATSTSSFLKINNSPRLMAMINLILESITPVTYVSIRLFLVSVKLLYNLRANFIG